MSVTVEAVKELLAKIPNLKELIKEAEAPKVRTWSDTAWIYNGCEDRILTHLGIDYTIKRGELTKINSLANYKEIDQGKSTGDEVVWTPVPMTGEFIACELIYEHGFHEQGFMVLTEPTISEADRRRCDDLARRYKLQRIEQFKIHRDKARAGIVGYKINPDKRVYDWMLEYTPDDAMFAEQSRNRDSSSQIAAAIEMLTRLVAGQQRAVSPASAPAEEPPASPTVTLPATLPVFSQEYFSKRPARRPLEKPEVYAARMAQWDQDKAEWEAKARQGTPEEAPVQS